MLVIIDIEIYLTPQRCLIYTTTNNDRPILDIATYRKFEFYRNITSARY